MHLWTQKMTYDNTNSNDQIPESSSCSAKNHPQPPACNGSIEDQLDISEIDHRIDQEPSESTEKVDENDDCSPSAAQDNSQGHHAGNGVACYDQILNDEIRTRLDKLNALSDLINSLEGQFDEANSFFRDTLQCSTRRLSEIAKTLGKNSVRQGRIYHTAKIYLEQSQSDCQRACVQFEQANKDHQCAKDAIREAEQKLREIAGKPANDVITTSYSDVNSIDMQKLCISDESCPTQSNSSASSQNEKHDNSNSESSTVSNNCNSIAQSYCASSSSGINSKSAAELSEDLNKAIMSLVEAEKQRGQSERQHLDRANKLMIAQENLTKLEREHGPSIRRSQLYFDEAKRFNAKLSSVKGDICRISDEIIAAKQAYARTLSELEQFSDDLHDSSHKIP